MLLLLLTFLLFWSQLVTHSWHVYLSRHVYSAKYGRTRPHQMVTKETKHQVFDGKHQPQISIVAKELSTAIRYSEPAPFS